jgi:hypothetical protein
VRRRNKRVDKGGEEKKIEAMLGFCDGGGGF